MAGKATYQGLEQRIEELDNEVRAFKSLYEELERMFNFSLDMIGSGNLEGYFTKINRSFVEILGYPEEDFLNKPFLSFVHQDDFETTSKALEDAGKGKRVIFIENRYKCKDGSYKWIEWKVQTILEENKFIAVGRDITDRKHIEEDLKKHRNHLKELVAERTRDLQKANKELRAEISERRNAQERLQESEEQLRLSIEATRDGLWDWKINENNLLFSPRLKGLLGYEEGGEISNSMAYWVSRVHPDHLERFRHLEENIKETRSFNVDFLLRTKNGKYRWFNSRCIVLFDGNGNPYRLVGSLRDIEKEKQSEELIRKLTQSLITSQESERQMISRELHDSVAQDLSSAKIASEMLLKYKSLTPGVRKKISGISANLHNTLKNVRDLSYELRPPGLEKLGLTHAIHIFCKDFSDKTGVRVDFQAAGMDNIYLNYNTKINLYRLLQEGLNNVKKHADASNVKIRLVSSFPNIILRINDDGKGFDLKERLAKISNEKRMGLHNMHERVGLLQGKIKIESSLGKGTKIVIEIPHKEDNIGE